MTCSDCAKRMPDNLRKIYLRWGKQNSGVMVCAGMTFAFEWLYKNDYLKEEKLRGGVR